MDPAAAIRCILPVSVAALMGALLGCASHRPEAAATHASLQQPSAIANDRSRLTLDQIGPPLSLSPTTRAAVKPPPTEALVLYANAIDDLERHRAFSASILLRRAIAIDPNRFDLYLALGQADLEISGGNNGQSIEALQHAAAIQPDDLQLQLLLARQYLAAGDMTRALRCLRLATLTRQYPRDTADTAAVDLLLARVLQQQGYDLAALEQYVKVARWLAAGNIAPDDPDLGLLANSPQVVYFEIGQLYEKHHQYAQALAAYEPLAKAQSTDLSIQAKVLDLQEKLDRQDAATRQMASVISRFGDNAQTLALLHGLCDHFGAARQVKLLKQMHRQAPGDVGIVLTLAAALQQQDDVDAARDVLARAVAQTPDAAAIRHALFDLDSARSDMDGAARVLIAWLSAQPDDLDRVESLFSQLTQPSRSDALRLAHLQGISVPPDQRAAKLLLISDLANTWERGALAQQSLDEAVAIRPPLAPVFRADVDAIWARADWSDSEKADACQSLAHRAADAGDAALASEIRGRSLAYRRKTAEAVKAFAQAIAQGGSSPQLELTYALALAQQGESLQAEQIFWKLVSAHPRFDEGWAALHGFYESSNRLPEAINVLAQWLKANPSSPAARMQQAIYELQAGQSDLGFQQLQSILRDRDEDPTVLGELENIYSQAGHLDEFIAGLKAIHRQQPRNLVVVEAMVDLLAGSNRNIEAIHLLDETRPAVASDPELLSFLASLYERVGDQGMWMKTLADVLSEDPHNAGASNDLGYAWADAGKNLQKAEQLIRVALSAEPDNQAFLDSLGWVLYKRGRFEEAVGYFRRAIDSSEIPEPEVLDHYGDDLYRLGKIGDARAQWNRSLQQLKERQDAATPDDVKLQLAIEHKIQESQKGQAVQVAPLAEAQAATLPDDVQSR